MLCSCYKSGKCIACVCAVNGRQCNDESSCGKKCQSKQTSKCPSSLANEESTFVKKSELQVMLQELATSITTNLTTRLSQETSVAASRAQSSPTFRQEIGT